jgi:hypothetical protein
MKLIRIVSLIALVLVGGLSFTNQPAQQQGMPTSTAQPSATAPPMPMTAATASSQAPPKPAALTVCPAGPPACQYSKIQEAIDAAPPRSTLFIQPGTYEENLVLAKSLQLIGTEMDQVRIQGTQVGGDTVTLQLERDNELHILLEGLTILGLPDSKGFSTAIRIKGQGSLVLTVSDSAITHTRTGLACNVLSSGSAQIAIIHSRIASTHAGVDGNCGFRSAMMQLQDVTFLAEGLHNAGVVWPFNDPPLGATPAHLIIERSRFIGNSVGVFASYLQNGVLIIRDSWFLNNSAIGVHITTITEGSSVEIHGTQFIGNEAGLQFGAADGIVDHLHGKLFVEGSSFLGNRRFGLWAGSGNAEIRNSLFQANGTGISVAQAGVSDNRRADAPPLQIERNRIIGNHDYGVALWRARCLPADQAPPVELPTIIRIQGQGNEMHDNGKGNLCPLDYNWPADFIKKP